MSKGRLGGEKVVQNFYGARRIFRRFRGEVCGRRGRDRKVRAAGGKKTETSVSNLAVLKFVHLPWSKMTQSHAMIYIVSEFKFSAHDAFEKSILFQLWEYQKQHPEIVGYVTDRARVFVPSAIKTTAPEPDLALFQSAPDVDWREVEPFIVGEVLRGDDINKDLFRNVGLYWAVPSIREYWVFDIRADARRAKLIVYQRGPSGWSITEHSADSAYETPLLPGLKLAISLPQP